MSWTRLTHLTLGAGLALGGGVLLLAQLPATRPVGFQLVMGAVLVVAGAVVVAAGLVAWLRLGRPGWSVVMLTAAAGTCASLLVQRRGVQAQFDRYHFYGYPEPWLYHHAWYADLSAAPLRLQWATSRDHLAMDLVFWGCVGVLLGTAIRALGRPRRVVPAGKVVAAA